MNTNVPRNLSGTIEIDGLPIHWSLRHEAVWTRGEGWTGLTIAVRLVDPEVYREAVIEYPYLPGNVRNRPKMQVNYIKGAIEAALRAGWDPHSRGKPEHYTLERDDVTF